MSEGRVVFYGFAVIYLIGVIVQFFLAGLALFGSTSYDAHQGLGYLLGVLAVVLLVIAVAAKLPRSLTGLSITLVVLNVVQIVLLRSDIAEIDALHVVNALAIAFVANVLAHRSRRYLASKLAAP
ncbi:MAG TPA: DUF6220 domain-containing protein [Gaiellaceae bacterium]|nr:DUF6220 domain-containing protein [Gaiellaceae bacterium]